MSNRPPDEQQRTPRESIRRQLERLQQIENILKALADESQPEEYLMLLLKSLPDALRVLHEEHTTIFEALRERPALSVPPDGQMNGELRRYQSALQQSLELVPRIESLLSQRLQDLLPRVDQRVTHLRALSTYAVTSVR